ncbi:MAG: hypothetical protein ACYDCL_22935 [Myxococcales bacterium]
MQIGCGGGAPSSTAGGTSAGSGSTTGGSQSGTGTTGGNSQYDTLTGTFTDSADNVAATFSGAMVECNCSPWSFHATPNFGSSSKPLVATVTTPSGLSGGLTIALSTENGGTPGTYFCDAGSNWIAFTLTGNGSPWNHATWQAGTNGPYVAAPPGSWCNLTVGAATQKLNGDGSPSDLYYTHGSLNAGLVSTDAGSADIGSLSMTW